MCNRLCEIGDEPRCLNQTIQKILGWDRQTNIFRRFHLYYIKNTASFSIVTAFSLLFLFERKITQHLFIFEEATTFITKASDELFSLKRSYESCLN